MNTYVLADDLSGALEAGAAFRAGGTPVTLTFNPTEAVAPGQLRVVSSETRNLAPAAASAVVARLLESESASGGRLLFKKIDSTLRGPVGAEIAALLAALAPPLVVVCPANPAVGRAVQAGRLLVEGVPVAETEFGRDPGWPVTESRVAEILGKGGVRVTTHLALDELRNLTVLDAARRIGVMVSDAATPEDLAQLVRVVRGSEPAAVFVGSGGLAKALAGDKADLAPRTWKLPRPVLIVSGSKSARSRRQLETLRDQQAVSLLEVPEASDRDPVRVAELVRMLAGRGAAALTITPDFSTSDPALPVRRLVDIVRSLVASGAEPAMLAATGGETARALCAALDIDGVDLDGEIEPGVVVARVRSLVARNLAALVIKPGGFGSVGIWENIIPNRFTIT